MTNETQRLAPPAAVTAVPTWTVDPAHSSVEFSVKHLMIATVTGRFGGVQGILHLDPQAPGLARVEGSVDTATVTTGDEKRDAHLRSPDFFDAEQHPKIRFRSKSLLLKGAEEASVLGDLTIRGVTREVPFDVTFDGAATDPWGNQRAAFTAEATIHRKDFGLTWNMALETGGVLVGDKVRLTLRLSAVQQKPA